MMIRAEVERAQRVEGGRLADLYVRHGPGAVRLAYLITGDRALAEDLAQEAFARLAARFLDIRAPEAFEAYLRKTVVNLCNSHFRRKRVERAYLERVGGTLDIETFQPDVDSKQLIRQALFQLPPRQRAAIVLRYYGDLSEVETARILGCRVGTVKSLVSRGMDKLRIEVRRE
ncbi:MAG TPA: SigE family RNA polymerase sigma factor [Actinomycetota bacterium]|nr:SigE family RNA polymerase sigma factor [Actinomycetota bacterium]